MALGYKHILSHSSLDTFLTCPRMYDANYVTADYQQVWGPKTPEQLAGIAIHKDFEVALTHKAPLPPKYKNDKFILASHKRVLAITDKIKGNLSTEVPIAIDEHFNPVDYKDKHRAWFRGNIDIVSIAESGLTGYVADLKNGKSGWQKPDQLDRMAVMLFQENMSLNKIIAEYFYVQAKEKFTYYYTRSKKTKEQWQKTLPEDTPVKTETDLSDNLKYETSLIQLCKDTGEWPKKRNGLCKKHCPVLNCEFNGKFIGN